MAWLRGIQVSVVPRREQRLPNGSPPPSPDKTPRKRGLPEYPHPDSSSVRLVRPESQALSPSPSVVSSDSNPDSSRIPKTRPRVSVYIPSDPGTQFGFEWIIDRIPENATHMYFILFINGRRIVSWGTDTKNTNQGITEYALYEPSERWNYSNRGVTLKREGVEKRYFYFSPVVENASAANDGGLIEVQTFRSKGRRRRAPEPGEYRVQDRYGITCPSGGLVEAPQDLSYFSWVLVDPKDSPYATFRFYYRSWDSLRDLNLIPEVASVPSLAALSVVPEEVEPLLDPESVHRSPSMSPVFDSGSLDATVFGSNNIDRATRPEEDKHETQRRFERKRSETYSLKSPPELLPAGSADKQLPQPSKTNRDAFTDSYLQRPLPSLPQDELPSRSASVTSRTSATSHASMVSRASVASRTPSITPSLLPYLDDMNSEYDEVEFGVATRVALSSVKADMAGSELDCDRPLPEPPRASSPSDYGASPPPSETSQLSASLPKKEYMVTNGNALEKHISGYSTPAPAPAPSNLTGVKDVVHVIIPEGQWIKRSPGRRTPSPLRRRQTQVGLNQIAGLQTEGTRGRAQ